MKLSNLALRLEEFEHDTPPRVEPRHGSPMTIVTTPDASRARPRRLTLTTRRALARDPGPRHFRVF